MPPLSSPPPPPAQIGSLGIFWTLMEPVLAALGARRVCEVGVAAGALTARLLAWGREHGCSYVGIDPAPDDTVRGWFSPEDARQLRVETSLAVLPTLGL